MTKFRDLVSFYLPKLNDLEIDNGFLDIVIIFQLVSNFSKEKIIITNPSIDSKSLAKFKNLINRRIKLEPVAYITGLKEFYGLDFEVNNSVLIPRPDTEILVEECLSYYKNIANLSFLDIGTGSGCISISISKNLVKSSAISIDISKDAIKLAKRNAKKNQVNHLIKFQIADFRKFFSREKFDFIVSNPPYISLVDYNQLSKNVKEYEPRIALTDEDSGLVFYQLIAEKAKYMLNDQGRIILEFGINQVETIKEIFLSEGWIFEKVVKDFGNIERVICFRK